MSWGRPTAVVSLSGESVRHRRQTPLKLPPKGQSFYMIQHGIEVVFNHIVDQAVIGNEVVPCVILTRIIAAKNEGAALRKYLKEPSKRGAGLGSDYVGFRSCHFIGCYNHEWMEVHKLWEGTDTPIE